MLTTTSMKNCQKAFLIGVYKTTNEKEMSEYLLEELRNLCTTYGIEVIEKSLSPLKRIDSRNLLGIGKLRELLMKIDLLKGDLVVFDEELVPHQQRNLENFFRRPVIDRRELIIEIFAQRAHTKEAKLQVELAKIRYQLPRLKRLWTHLSRQTGGKAPLRGVGELQIELDRRSMRKKIVLLKREIEEIEKRRHLQRSQRIKRKIPTFAIVGYTNAGKSTLLNALTQAGVLVEDKLFATLDTTTRKYLLPNRREILLIDTVGFIHKIPHSLIAAFKGTLEEIVYTDVILHLIDASNPMAAFQAQTGIEILHNMHVTLQPIITLLNKIDLCPESPLLPRLRAQYPKTVLISAQTGEGLEQLLEFMMEETGKFRTIFHLQIPQSHYSLVSELLQQGSVRKCEYEENDILLEVELPKDMEYKVQSFIIKTKY